MRPVPVGDRSSLAVGQFRGKLFFAGLGGVQFLPGPGEFLRGLLAGTGGFFGRRVGFFLSGLGPALGLLRPGGACIGGGDLFGCLAGDRLDLRFRRLGVPHGAQFLHQHGELLSQKFDHAGNLAGDLAGPLAGQVNRPCLGRPGGSVIDLLAGPPGGSAVVGGVVAVFRWPAGRWVSVSCTRVAPPVLIRRGRLPPQRRARQVPRGWS